MELNDYELALVYETQHPHESLALSKQVCTLHESLW